MKEKEQAEFITAPDAAKKAKITAKTIRRWAEEDPQLGVKVKGRWRINAAVLDRIINGTQPSNSEEIRIAS